MKNFFLRVPSDIFGFLGGAIFAIGFDLIRERLRAEPANSSNGGPTGSLLVVIVLSFMLGAFCLVFIASQINAARTSEFNRPLTGRDVAGNIGDRLTLLTALLLSAIVLIGLGSWLILRP